jgi:hypothetical protein
MSAAVECGRCGQVIARRTRSGLCASCWRSIPLAVRTFDPSRIDEESAVAILRALLRVSAEWLPRALAAAAPAHELPAEYLEQLRRDAYEDGFVAGRCLTP